jgi:hypothetical protein
MPLWPMDYSWTFGDTSRRQLATEEKLTLKLRIPNQVTKPGGKADEKGLDFSGSS